MQDTSPCTTVCGANELLLSTTTFWFWYPDYDADRNIELIRTLELDVDGLDIWLFVTAGFRMPQFRREVRRFIESRRHVTFHTDFYDVDWAGGKPDLAEFAARLDELQRTGDEYGVRNVVIHADFLVGRNFHLLDMLRQHLPRMRVSLETMDHTKSYGTRPEDFLDIFTHDGGFGLVPDIAHINDFRGQYHWRDMLCRPELSERISYVHASVHSAALKANFYAAQGFPEISATHSFVLAGADLVADMLGEAAKHPMVVEGIVPPGDVGVRLLSEEIALLKNWKVQE